ncbi:hypothetical protein TNCV_665261 [Trichonephila clavipes]|uniref:Transposase n=1 Tax=Trichonephila clavipes TaxID=2585209 RepID=A0A8X6SKK8_TRICX|nr:hypothetical protein TNCV_665261 [Trichonephila clavipes]
MSAGMRLQMVWLVRAAIKILRLFQNLLPGSNKISEDMEASQWTHTYAQLHVAGLRVYPPCPNCNVTQAAPVHILACIGCHKSQLLSSPATVL